MEFDYLALGDAAVSLGIPKSTLRHYCELGKIAVKRGSDGSRLFEPEAIEQARQWLKKDALEKAQARREVEKRRQLKARFDANRLKARRRRSA